MLQDGELEGWDVFLSPPGRDPSGLWPQERGRLPGEAWATLSLDPALPTPHFLPSSQEPSPYDESEVHDSFHQLIQEQSQWVAEEGLELQHRGSGAGTPGTSGESTGAGH